MEEPGATQPGASAAGEHSAQAQVLAAVARWRPPQWVEALSGYSWRMVIVGVAAFLVFGLFLAVSVIVIGLLLALLLATLFIPLIRWLRRHGASKLVAAIVGIVVLLGSLFFAGFITTRSVVSQWDEMSASIGVGVDKATADAGDAAGLSDETSAGVADDLKGAGTAIGKVVLSGAVILAPRLINLVTTVGLSIFILFCFLKDGDLMWAWLLERSPIDRTLASELGDDTWRTLSGYFRGVALVAAVDAVFIGVGVWIIGVPFAGAIAVLTFFAAFIPTVGAILAGAVACFIALAEGGWSMAFATLVVVILVQQLESNILQPLIIGRATKLHPLIVFLAITAGAVLAGVIGMFLAVPLTAVSVTIISRLRRAGVFA